jgi:HAD superfamily hydrolase (TIGR01549 family)
MIICFDLDGTLVDTGNWILSSTKNVFEKNNLKFNKKKLIKLWGLTFKSQLKKLFPTLKKTEIDKIEKEFQEERKKTIHKIKPFKNTKKTLKTLSKKYSLALLSNNPHYMINKILKQTKIDRKLFDIIIGDDEVRKPKPFPNEIKKAERKLKKKAKFMIGDTKQDILTAKRAKIKSIIIKRRIVPKKDLKEADFIIKDIKQLPKIIKEVK